MTDSMSDPMFVPVVHDGCGETAFFLRTGVKSSDPIRHEDFRLLDGSTPRATDLITCGACGAEGIPRIPFVSRDGVWYLRGVESDANRQ